ncbi:MAG: hypothetical protein VX278_09240 [Myxococcota bacterium]|nr:hypothetical protein [Myxococcota bacterium]
MIFFLWMVSAEPSELPVSDQKVIRYILEKESERVLPEETPPPEMETDQLLEDRLLGQNDTLEEEIQKNDPAYLPWWWSIILLAMLAGALRLFVKRTKAQVQSINVLSRTFFGREGSVAVIEVKDSEQTTKRFLLGFNTGSAPSLLADLSSPVAFPDIIPVTPTLDELKINSTQSKGTNDKDSKRISKRKTRKDKPKDVRRGVTASSQKLDILVGEPNTSEKEELVEEILRLREKKHEDPETEKEAKEKPKETRDKWADGFNEIFRK